MTCRDSIGNPVQVDDVVNVANPHSAFNGQKGIIKNMSSKNVLFLWDHKFMQRSAGIFTELAKNVTIRGHEYINKGGQSQSRPNQNRIGKHEWLYKEVHITAGEFKG